jgi:hypothetical protein
MLADLPACPRTYNRDDVLRFFGQEVASPAFPSHEFGLATSER